MKISKENIENMGFKGSLEYLNSDKYIPKTNNEKIFIKEALKAEEALNQIGKHISTKTFEYSVCIILRKKRLK